MLANTTRNHSFIGCVAGTLTALLALGLPGCATVDGSLTLSGGTLGAVEFKPSSCKSGQHYNFLGVDLFAANPEDSTSRASAPPPTFRVVNGVVTKDPAPSAPASDESVSKLGTLRVINDALRGPVVRYFDPRLGGGYLQFTPEVCQRLTVDAENTQSPYGNRDRYAATSGSMRLQCSLPDGTSVSGAISFAGCQ